MTLRCLKNLLGYKLAGTDDTIGSVADFLFDDVYWTVRYLVVDTGHWLPGRQVLLSPAAIHKPIDDDRKHLPVDLTTDQIAHSPGIQEDMPVSRQNERELAQYYGWATYWDRLPSSDPASMTHAQPASPPAETAQDEPKLRSLDELVGYTVEGPDEKLGHVEDAVAETVGWMLRYLVVDTRRILPGKKVLVSPTWAREVTWADRHILTDIDAQAVKQGPTFDPDQVLSREYEAQLHEHHGRAGYWQ